MSIPQLIKSILAIHDLEQRVNHTQNQIETLQSALQTESQLNAHLTERVKDLEEEQRYAVSEKDVNALIEDHLTNGSLPEAVDRYLEDLSITLKIN